MELQDKIKLLVSNLDALEQYAGEIATIVQELQDPPTYGTGSEDEDEEWQKHIVTNQIDGIMSNLAWIAWDLSRIVGSSEEWCEQWLISWWNTEAENRWEDMEEYIRFMMEQLPKRMKWVEAIKSME